MGKLHALGILAIWRALAGHDQVVTLVVASNDRAQILELRHGNGDEGIWLIVLEVLEVIRHGGEAAHLEKLIGKLTQVRILVVIWEVAFEETFDVGLWCILALRPGPLLVCTFVIVREPPPGFSRSALKAGH